MVRDITALWHIAAISFKAQFLLCDSVVVVSSQEEGLAPAVSLSKLERGQAPFLT